MIRETFNSQRLPSVTSDHWHVIHARWSGVAQKEPRFIRSVVSEHADCDKARIAASELRMRLKPKMKGRAALERDQVFVRRPKFKSLANAKRIVRKKK